MEGDVSVEVRNLVKHFPLKLGFFKTLTTKEIPQVHAVDGVSFAVEKGQI